MLTNKEMTIIKVSLATGGSVITMQATPLKSKRGRESYFNSKAHPQYNYYHGCRGFGSPNKVNIGVQVCNI